VVLFLATIGFIMEQVESAPKTLAEAKKAAVGVWIDDNLVMDRTVKMVLNKNGNYEYYLAVKGDSSWGEPDGTGTYEVEETEVMTNSGNTEKAYQITWTYDGMTAEYIFDKKNAIYNRTQVMKKGNSNRP